MPILGACDAQAADQVLVANLLLIVAAVLAALATTDSASARRPGGDRARPRGRADGPRQLFMLQRRFAPSSAWSTRWSAPTCRRPGRQPAAPVDGVGEPEEVERLQLAFRRMLERLEAERRRTSSAALHAQEEERARVARDLHDEVNQSLTGLLLRLEAAREKAPPELAAELAETKALANQAMRSC